MCCTKGKKRKRRGKKPTHPPFPDDIWGRKGEKKEAPYFRCLILQRMHVIGERGKKEREQRVIKLQFLGLAKAMQKKKKGRLIRTGPTSISYLNNS